MKVGTSFLLTIAMTGQTFLPVFAEEIEEDPIVEEEVIEEVEEKVEDQVEEEISEDVIDEEPIVEETVVEETVVEEAKNTLVTPTMSNLTNTQSGIKVRWSEVSGAQSYVLYRKVGSGSWSTYESYISAWDTSSTTAQYIDTNVESGKQYYYRVKAVNGGEETSVSSSKYIRYLATPNITKYENTNNGIKIKFSSATGCDKYLVYKYVSGSRKLIATITTTEYTDEEATTNNTTYEYQVRAKVGNNTYSDYCDLTECARLNAPKLKSAKNSDTGVYFSWYSLSGATSYNVYRKVSGGSWKLIKKDLNSTYYLDETATSGKKYYYSVKAKNLKTISAYNESGKYVTYLSKPSITSVATGSTYATIKWDAVGGAESYIIYTENLNTGAYTKIGTSTTNSFKYDGIDAGTFNFVVKAKVLTATYSVYSDYYTYKRIKTPKLIYSGAHTNSMQAFAWNEVSGVDSYIVYRKEVSPNKTSWKKLVTLDSTRNSHMDFTVESGKSYAYTVQAVQGSLKSGYDPNGVIPNNY